MIDEKTVKHFLETVNYDFPIPLSDKIDIGKLAEKYCAKATICCKYSGNQIIAMVAGYTDNTVDQMGYISFVASLKECRRKGYSSILIQEFLDIAKKKKLKAVHVYTHKKNDVAIAMYLKNGFFRYYPENEPRPEDIHFCCWF